MPTDRPRLLDLFCGAGGSSAGFARAGFDVTGCDNRPQPRYPFRFVLGDALQYVAAHGREYDVIAASPPCQHYSRTQRIHGRDYPDLIPATRRLLMAAGRPYVIENVEEAPLACSVRLCGAMFGLRVYRHRRFESSVFLWTPEHPAHRKAAVAVGRRSEDPAAFYTVAGHVSQIARCREAMGIDWMTREELVEAVPPAYTLWVGRQVANALGVTRAD